MVDIAEIGELLPSLRDLRLLEGDPGLTPWAKICRSSGAGLEWRTPANNSLVIEQRSINKANVPQLAVVVGRP